jgi:acetolactate synthase-1/2/3 large subunit
VKIKLSDYVASYLEKKGLSTVFGVTGGASIHLMHSVHINTNLNMVACHHEQAASMAADGYARASGGTGCAIATSGPGATNLITGISGSWFDSIPVLHLTGQVATFRMKRDTGTRQLGFQETDIVQMVKGITKFAHQLEDPLEIHSLLDEAFFQMHDGRKGPALIDIPDNLQREEFELRDFVGKVKTHFPLDQTATTNASDLNKVKQVADLVLRSKRPVLVIGSGTRDYDSRVEIEKILQKLPIPILTTWGAKDVVSTNYEMHAGTFGTHGTRAGNFTIQNADLVITVGTRLSTKETGTPVTDWAREAQLVMVDIDESEISKFKKLGKEVSIGICTYAQNFLTLFNQELQAREIPRYTSWNARVKSWKLKYPHMEVQKNLDNGEHYLTPQEFIQFVQQFVNPKTDLFVDTGCAVAWIMQGLTVPHGSRVFHDHNNTAMGWALPASIGGSFANPERETICVVGDGSLMMNLQELATLKHSGRPVRIILLNNSGYAMVRQTEAQWLDSRHVGTDLTGSGLSFPNFPELFQSFRMSVESINKSNIHLFDLNKNTRVDEIEAFNLLVGSDFGVSPQTRFGYPIEDSDPLLPRNEFLDNMIVKPKDISLT